MIDNFEHLVARCEAMRRRRMIRLSLMIVGTLLFIIAGISGYTMWLDTRNPSVPAVKKTQASSMVEANTTLSEPLAVHETNQTALLNSTPIITPAAVQATAPTVVSAPIKTSVATAPAPTARPAEIKPEVILPIADTAAPGPKSSRLFEVNTQSYTNPVDAYKSNPKYETALAAARDFYAKENFVEAANWAKKANQLNREDEEAWLLYAKSYYAQGRKNEAIGILELYLNYKDSKAASELIRTWKLTRAN
ncbi:tetratricopeptide repeat protein [Sulfuricurvum sp.]|uniref:tetratricopeptide repeat protein n=1 Tax=Sulfuricurvum sp. TaxID=2025608 RepID=UPI003BAEA275